MQPICSCCQPVPEVTVTDYAGRSWTFEMHRMFGPLVLRADGQPRDRQPGPRSSFWPAFETWRAAHRPPESRN